MAERRLRLLPLLTVGALSIAVLSGCSLIPHVTIPGGTGGGTSPSASSSDGSVGDSTGAVTDSPSSSDGSSGSGSGSGSTTGQTYTLPSNFPTADVPIIDGQIVYSADLGSGWLVWVHASDFSSAYTTARDALTSAGYTGEDAAVTSQGSVGQYSNTKYQVTLTAGHDADYGDAVSYTVVVLN